MNAVTPLPSGWIANGISDTVSSNAVWIAPIANQSQYGSEVPPADPEGSTTYTVSFTIPVGATSVTLKINMSADDYVTATLNPTGSDTTIYTYTGTTGLWDTTTGTLTINTAADFVIGGVNTIQFVVPNIQTDLLGTANCCGPTGLQVDADVTYTPAATPEPATLSLVGLALVGLGGWRWRSRRS